MDVRYRAQIVLVTILLILLGGSMPHAAATACEDMGSYLLCRDLTYGPAPSPDNLVDLYLPSSTGPFPAVVVIHGGGWIDGDKTEWAAEAIKLTAAGFVAVAPNYRLAPENTYPAALNDLQLLVEWIRANAAAYKIDPMNIGALGGSTGAHLAALLAMKGKGSVTDGDRIGAAASWSGKMNLITAPRNVPRFLGCSYNACPETWKDASPYYNVDPSDPALYLANSTDERVPLEQAEKMAAKLDQKGVPNQLRIIPGSKHSRSYEKQVWDETVAFLHAYLNAA